MNSSTTFSQVMQRFEWPSMSPVLVAATVRPNPAVDPVPFGHLEHWSCRKTQFARTPMSPQQNRPHKTAPKRRSHALEWSDQPRNRHAATPQV